MKTTTPCYLAFLALLLGASPSATPWPDLLDQGDAAFARRDFVEAKRLYEEAEPHCLDPGRVTFALASTSFRLSQVEPDRRVEHLHEASRLYRMCLSPHEPNRVASLFGLATCLIEGSDGRDPKPLREAMGLLKECLELAGPQSRLADDAHHNLERARLYLAQIPPTAGDPPRPPENENPQHNSGNREQPMTGAVQPIPGQGSTPVTPMPGTMTQKSGKTQEEGKSNQAPGEGNLPPVPDRDTTSPLSEEDARAHLEQAVTRILLEKHQHRQSSARPPAKDVKDW
jgi:hypothetical protein